MHLRHVPGTARRYHCCDLSFSNQLWARRHLCDAHTMRRAEAMAQVAALRPCPVVDGCRYCALPRLRGTSTHQHGPRWVPRVLDLEAITDEQGPIATMARAVLLRAIRDAQGRRQLCSRSEHAGVQQDARLFFGVWYALYDDDSFLAFWCDVAGADPAILHRAMAPYCVQQDPQEIAL